MKSKHKPHEYFSNRCRYCATLETIWDCIDCYGFPVRNQYLDDTAATLKADKRTEYEKIEDFIKKETGKRIIGFYNKRERNK